MIQLYSFRRCPYAIRARLALHLSKVSYQVIEVNLKDKPQHLLEISPKGTVPVLFGDGLLIDESIDIVRYAFTQRLPTGFVSLDFEDPDAASIVEQLHQVFIPSLNRFKYAVRYENVDLQHEKMLMLRFLSQFKAIDEGLLGPKTWLDCVCLPLIRQAYKADGWTEPWPEDVLSWLNAWLVSDAFQVIMAK